jgi:hypothetical protein
MSAGSENYVDPLERNPKFKQLMISRQPQLTPGANLSRMALTARQQLDWNSITRPCIYKVSASTIDSTSTGDTVLLTGVTNKTLIVNNISCYQSSTGSGTFRLEMDYGSSFGSTARISETSTNDKETQGQQLILKSTERIVLNVTTSAGSSAIDVVVSYQELGFGTVY